MKKSFVLFCTVVLLAATPFSSGFSQCAMCKAVTKSNLESGNQVGKGINKGVLYLLSVPYILAGIGGLIWYRNKKRQIV